MQINRMRYSEVFLLLKLIAAIPMGMALPPDPHGPQRFQENFKWITDAQEFALKSKPDPDNPLARIVNQVICP